MIGNDIIDLAQAKAESNWQRKGWLQKLFCNEELEMIRVASEKEPMVWLLWSMKEAAYKIVHRRHKKMFYAPHKFVCNLNNTAIAGITGNVRFHSDVYTTTSIFSSAFIHTIALAENNLPPRNVYIRNEYENRPSCFYDHVFYKDPSGVPYLRDKHGTIKDVSKSHHGRFEAIVF